MLNFDTDNKEAGYRLDYLQVINWGLYSNNEVFTINPKSKSSLLIGGNASGKTTLVDAILTLFLSRPKYNLAGDSQKKHDRDIASYIFGNYSEFTNEKGEIEPEQLRKTSDYSIILAAFSNKGLKQNMTLGQFFWFNKLDSKTPERLYFIAFDKAIHIEKDLYLNDVTSISDFKKRLELLKIYTLGTKNYPDRKGIYTDKFTLYSDKFCEFFGIKNKDKALNLFNQTVSLKNIGDLNSFIKNEMLENHNLEGEIEKIKNAFDDAKMFSDKIDEVDRKIELLKPINENFEKYNSLKEENTKIHSVLKVLDSFFATLKKNLLEKEIKAKADDLKILNDEFNEKFDESVGTLKKRKDDIKQIESNITAIENNTGIKQIESDILLNTANLEPVKTKFNNFSNELVKLGFNVPNNAELFNENKIKINAINTKYIEKSTELNTKKDNFIKEIIAPIEQKIKELKDEKENLEKNTGSLIEKKYENARTKICDFLKIDKKELPYVCELLKIKDNEKEWQSAIEKLFRNLGLSLLVTEIQYDKICEYFNKYTLNDVKIQFIKVQNGNKEETFSEKPNFLLNKLEFKPEINKQIVNWIKQTIFDLYTYVGCSDLNSFYHTEKAFTKNGLIKHNLSFHEKDDTKQANNFILGWDNSQKIEMLKQEMGIDIVNLENEQLEQKKIEDEIKQITEKQAVASEILKINDFSEIDYNYIEQKIKELNKKLGNLKDDRELIDLKGKFREITQEIENLETRKTKLTVDRATLNSEINANETAVKDCDTEISTITKFEQEENFQFVFHYIKNEIKHSNQIVENKRNVKIELQKAQSKLEEPFENIKKNITDKMLVFNQEFRDDAKRLELHNEIGFIDEYVELFNKLKEDDLPILRDQFDEKLRKRSDKIIIDFKMVLERQENQIKKKISDINQLLKKRDYQENKSFLKIIHHKTQNAEIELFKKELISCVYPSGGEFTPEQRNEKNKFIFKNIKSLLEKLEKYNLPGDRWASTVTDVRNWFYFTASERDIQNEESEIKAHSGTGGKSGGETFKITYTILASAIADEFGLDAKNEAKTHTLRFIAIDEIFNNLGVTWSHYVLKMFEDMDLQLLIVSPDSLEKANIAKDHITNVHWTYKKTIFQHDRNEDNSYVVDLTFKELQGKFIK